MLFATGMGIGLVFWGVAEPLGLMVDPKPGITGPPEILAQIALAQTYIHWGIHAWATYAIVGLAIGYAVHRRGRSVSMRWALEPLLGDRVEGRLGDIIDVTAIVGGVFGIATSLGLGVLQFGAGAEHTGFADNTLTLQLIAAVIITAAATISVYTGLQKGLKWLSNANVGIATLLLAFVLLAGPTLFIFRLFVQSLGTYLTGFLEMTFNVSTFAGAEGEEWQATWSTFFWASWISWAPLVGIFIARISKGRTVREFITGVLIVPALVSFFWFAAFGGAAFYQELFGPGGLVPPGGVVAEFALFDLLGELPLTTLMSVVSLVLIVTFLVSSIDSGSFTLAMLSFGGEAEPPVWSRILWAITGGAVGAALVVTGGLAPLQTAVILMALPFSFIMVAIAMATAKTFYAEAEAREKAETRAIRDELADQVATILRTPDGEGAPLPSVEITKWRIPALTDTTDD